jgi:hypothetical protein
LCHTGVESAGLLTIRRGRTFWHFGCVLGTMLIQGIRIHTYTFYGILVISLLCAPRVANAQQVANSEPVQQDSSVDAKPPEPEHKRIFWIIPNYRTSPSLKEYKPLTAHEKFAIAAQDSLDPGTFMLAAAFGGEAQFFSSSPSFGHGVTGYARYALASYGDWVTGNVMTEALYPTILHQDPRYFRRGEGSGWSRLRYAVGQIFWTHTDSGGTQFNFSEIVGNATAVAMSNIYYPDNRTVANGASKLAVQVSVDMLSNILKEFSPDLDRALSRKHRPKAP